jgi:hypothetical protein
MATPLSWLHTRRGQHCRTAWQLTTAAICWIALVIFYHEAGLAAAAEPTKYGIAYFLWHCLTKDYPVYDVSNYEAGLQALGPVPQFHWWGKPAAGYYCLSDDDALLRQHATALAQAGIDFVFVDFSNHDNLSYDRVAVEYLDPFSKMLTVWSQIPDAPKIVPFVQVTPRGDLYAEIVRRLQQYPNLAFIYMGKPLLLLVANQAVPVDTAKRAELDTRFTARLMWDDSSPQGIWMFISRCQPGFVESKGNIDCKQRVASNGGAVEQVSVSAAFQRDYMSDTATAAPRYHGLTFLKQMARLDDLGPVPIVTILGWNQWIAQRFCVRRDMSPDPACAPGSRAEITGNPVFTDLFDEEYSTDFEPGGSMGDAYYQLLSCEVHRRKTGSLTPCRTPD